ncbi:alpha/beta fold hydrolase [Solirubrobacter soli]|uniref:alpha/beta fold hydrolase n=1 Tax=Solirubrobacter soli TaxID=363832 RepID=UPI0004193406|nr:alpha/beta hydrolase [Solirubrobacter soli]
MFEGFAVTDVDTPRGTIRARVGGAGPPLLVLHGFPETHLMWHPVAATLAERFTVVAPDLPGYGDSFRPPVTDDHFSHSKRAWAADLIAAMRELGHSSFALVGHDRGGRVAYRMALDHPDVVKRLAVLDIVPTGEIWARVDPVLMLGYWHWAFLAQPAPLPEQLISAAPDTFWLAGERIGLKPGDPRYPDDVLAVYRAQLDDPDHVVAVCEDYRASATIDRAHDAEGGTIDCPVLALWGGAGGLPRFYSDPLDLWRAFAPHVTGRAIEGASHFLVEDAPEEVVAELTAFLT